MIELGNISAQKPWVCLNVHQALRKVKGIGEEQTEMALGGHPMSPAAQGTD